MTIPTTIAASGPYTPNGVTTAFPFGFKAPSTGDVSVVLISDDGTEEVVSSASYTVTLAAGDDPGGTVTMAIAPVADGRALWIYLDPSFLQEIKFEDEGAFNQTILNQLADEAGSRIVWLQSRAKRSIALPFGEEAVVLPKAATRAGKILGFDLAGDPYVLTPVASAAGAADIALTNVASASFGGKVFAQPSGVTSASLAQRFSHVINFQDDCGAVGENVTLNGTALANAINKAQLANAARANMPIGIYVPPGLYKFDASVAIPEITQAVVFFSDGTRTAQFVVTGDFSGTIDKGGGRIVNNAPFKFFGAAGVRSANAGFRNIGINAAGMTGGYAISVDWAQDFLLENFLLADPYKAFSLRQAGGTAFRKVLFDNVRNAGMLAYADNTSRNSQNDQIDLISFEKCVFQSGYVSGGASSAVELLTVDGRIHTIDVAGLRLLNAGKGMVAKNTPALASNFIPRFVTGYGLEVENMYAECLDLQALREFWMDNLFAVGSNTADGVKLSSNVAIFSLSKGTINSNKLHGLNVNGANYTRLTDTTVYNNSLVGVNVKSGVYVSGSGIFVMRGGLAGKDTSLPAYTEAQKFGVEQDAAFNGIIQVQGVDLRGNGTGPIYDPGNSAVGSHVRDCPGVTPGGAAVVPGASPWTYTAGLQDETLYIKGGTVSSVVMDGQTLASATGAVVTVPARRSVTVTYTVAPTASVIKM